MMDTVISPLFDPQIDSLLCTFLVTVSLLFTLLILFFGLLVVRIDGIVLWPWPFVWIPAWIVDFILLFSLVHYLFRPTQEQESKQYDPWIQGCQKSVYLIQFTLLIVFQVFIVLQLNSSLNWSACNIFIPYFVYEGIAWILNGIKILVGCLALDSMLERQKIPAFIFSQCWFSVLRFCTFLLIALRLDQYITCSWVIVFIPVYLTGFKWALELVYRYCVYSRMTQPDIAQQGKITVLVGAVAFMMIGILSYALIGLIARRLDGVLYVPMSSVFIPLFIVLSFCLCCSGCCLPCLLQLSVVSDLENAEWTRRFIDPSKRITG
ncbi:uncharacterized protein B0P05DRAFT_302528 [Gilbertella persicaria]|uniref:uncharacterized protein n=1 Tax=Gilbertella persicaria TaxID=101096 RepID=UPI00221FBC63|nr:uncharacterized protein B0P05DRAFT_302528 [Gilbertella persicaria]KAI8091165.1 hypothetical protein B0P05DRAFT_302528 [Gilbertella persicaria]